MDRCAAGNFRLPDALRIHDLPGMHFQNHRDEFVFRWNWRRHGATYFDRLPGLGPELEPAL